MVQTSGGGYQFRWLRAPRSLRGTSGALWGYFLLCCFVAILTSAGVGSFFGLFVLWPAAIVALILSKTHWSLGVAGVVLAAVFLYRRIRSGKTDSRSTFWWFVRYGCAAAITFVLASSSLPRELCFRMSLSAFKSLADAESPSPHRVNSISRRAGLYQVVDQVNCRSGGLYFRTRRPLVISDRYSPILGFAYGPSETDRPWGGASLELTHMTGDWYFFTVDDGS